MAGFAIYAIINILLSFALERRKLRRATVIHTVAFSWILLLLFVTAEPSSIAGEAIQKIFGENYYRIVANATVFLRASFLIPFASIEWSYALGALLLGALAVREILSAGKRQERRNFLRTPPLVRSFHDVFTPPRGKKYKIFCVMNC